MTRVSLHTWKTPLVGAAAALVFGLGAVAGKTPQVVRDPGAAPLTGTGAVSGIVVTDGAGNAPLKRATVRLTGAPFRGSGGLTAITSDNGRFEFTALAAGRYMLAAQKPAYLTRQYGATGRGRGSSIDLADGQQLTNVVLKLPRGGVITGNVRTPGGRPLSGVRVTILQYRFANGQRTLSQTATGPGGTDTTDDRGTYRLYGLPAGEYIVEAIPPTYTMNDVRPITTADIQWAQQQVQRNQPGAGAVAFAPGSTPAPTPARPIGYAPIFYPGNADVAGATAVTVASGEERTGVDFPLPYVPTAKIEGVILDANGQAVAPGSANINVTRAGYASAGWSGISLQMEQDGKFSSRNVPPGDYQITARVMPPARPPAARAAGPGRAGPRAGRAGPGAGAARAGGPEAPPEPETLWAATDVAVRGTDLSGITLRLQPGMTATGTMVFDAPVQPVPAFKGVFMRNVHVQLLPMVTEGAVFANQGMTEARINEDGSFALSGILPGLYRITTAGAGPLRGDGGAPGPWILERIMINGRDVTDRPFEIRPNDKLDDAVVTFFDRPAEIAGKLTDANGRPMPEFTVLLFSADKLFWGLQTRRTVQARPGADGSFRFASLLAGDYYVAAVTSVDASDLGDPAFFEDLIGASLKMTIREGDKKVQDLKLAGGGRRP